MKNKYKLNDSIINNENNAPFSYNQYLLSQLDNYKEKINKNLLYILEKYVELIIEYIKFISEKINIKNTNYFKFIFIRGYETITSVFKIMLFYTKNVDLTYYHSQKAFYFYVEFIEQISTDQNSFLQLSSREASLFVYKKTIFDINLEIKKKNKDLSYEETKILNKMDEIIFIYNHIILFCFNYLNFEEMTSIYIYLKDNISINSLLDLLPEQLECFQLLLNQLSSYYKNNDVKLYFEILPLFIKKLNVKKNKYELIKTKLLDYDFINHLTNSKILIDWLF
jgi:hypothetical protein